MQNIGRVFRSNVFNYTWLQFVKYELIIFSFLKKSWYWLLDTMQFVSLTHYTQYFIKQTFSFFFYFFIFFVIIYGSHFSFCFVINPCFKTSVLTSFIFLYTPYTPKRLVQFLAQDSYKFLHYFVLAKHTTFSLFKLACIMHG